MPRSTTLPPREDGGFPAAVHALATRRSWRAIVRSLRRDLGAMLLAVSVRAPSTAIVDAWAAGTQAPDPEQERLLRAAYEIVQTLLPWDAAATIRAWFAGMNPELDDRSPALVLAEDPTLVLHAAYAFIAA